MFEYMNFAFILIGYHIYKIAMPWYYFYTILLNIIQGVALYLSDTARNSYLTLFSDGGKTLTSNSLIMQTRNTFAVSFLCEASRAGKDGLSPIYVSISINTKRTRFPLTRKADPKTFAKMLNSRKTNEVKEFCTAIENRLYQIQTEMIRSAVPVTAANVRDYFRTGGTKTYTLEAMWDEYFLELTPKKGISLGDDAYNRYVWMRDFMYSQFGKDREVASLKKVEVEKLYIDLQTQNASSTAGSKFQKAKTVLTWAFENGKIPSNPAANIHITKKYKDPVWLRREELLTIAQKDLSYSPRLEVVRDLFVFQCSSGLAWIDLSQLEPGDLKTNDEGRWYISKDRVKTGQNYTAVILPLGVKVLEKYNFNLPKVCSNQKMNAYLKEICVICGIEKNITSHSGRHTYAMTLLNFKSKNGDRIRYETVQASIGHSQGSDITKRYCRLLNQTVIDEVVEVGNI